MTFYRISAQGRTNVLRVIFGTALVFFGCVLGAWIGLDRLNRMCGMPSSAIDWKLADLGVEDVLQQKTGIQLQQVIAKWNDWITPCIEKVDTKQKALTCMVGGVVLTSLGFVFCGAAGGGRWVLLCPVGALLGMPGWPLRHGRGGRLIRTVYVMVGVGLVAIGLYTMVSTAKTGGPDANQPMQWIAFAELSLGLAAVLGVVVRSRQLRLTVDALDSMTKRSRQSFSKESRGSCSESTLVMPPALISAIQSNPISVRRYIDPPLSVSLETQPKPDTNLITKSFESKGFDEPLLIEIMRPIGRSDATMQVGCRNMVLAITESCTDELRMRLTSVLEDGHLLVSVYAGDHGLQKDVTTDSITVRIERSNDTTKILSLHLEAVGQIAQRRGCGLAAIETMEWRDILHVSERALAHAAHVCGTEKWDIHAVKYGRFSFPSQPVCTLVEA